MNPPSSPPLPDPPRGARHASSRCSFQSLGLGAIFASLLGSAVTGCGSVLRDDEVGDCEPGEQIETRSAHATATEIVDAGLQADGVIRAAACPALCDAAAAVSCRDQGPLLGSTTTGGGGAGGIGGASAEGGASADGGGASDDELRVVQCKISVPTYCSGRRHVAVDGDLAATGPTEVAAWLARSTASEAVSVPAFLTLQDELIAHGAPQGLVEAAERAAAEEVRHADVMRGFAEHAGASPRAGFPKARPHQRSLFALALENVIEGCVNETFSGLIALYQSRFALAADFRRAMASIAEDEIGHGELAWAIHRWAITQLTPSEVVELVAAMREATDRLVDALAVEELSPGARAALGLPDGVSSVRMAQTLRTQLWS